MQLLTSGVLCLQQWLRPGRGKVVFVDARASQSRFLSHSVNLSGNKKVSKTLF